HKIIVAGNHDMMAEKDPDKFKTLITNAVYLQDSSVNIDGVNFYGTPWSLNFYPENWVFNQDLETARWRFSKIPKETDILICHGPPLGYGDLVGCRSAGCPHLLNAFKITNAHTLICGHIHEGYGSYRVRDFENKTIYNVAGLGRSNLREAVVIEI